MIPYYPTREREARDEKEIPYMTTSIKAAELLDSPKMKELIINLNKTYDYVIIDTPPIGLVTDGVILMQQTDINLYIIRHNFSKSKTLSIINNLYNQEQVKNVHLIINDFKYTESGYGYGYGYGTSDYGYYENED